MRRSRGTGSQGGRAPPESAPSTGARRTRARAASEDRQEPVDLPRGDLHPVVGPLLSLDLDEAVEGVLAEYAQHELRVRGDLDRLAQCLRKLLDPPLLALLGGQ